MLKTPSYIHFVKSAGYCSVQDQGRFGFADLGVPYSGAMDQFSYTLANKLLNNTEDSAVLEIAISGPTMVFEMATRIVFTGAQAEIFHNGNSVQLGQIISVNAEDVIRVGKIIRGQWLYMGIDGGLETPIFMDSRSWFAGISTFSKIQKADSICYFSEEKFSRKTLSHPKLTNAWFEEEKISVYKGPEWELLPDQLKTKILCTNFEISRNTNRMGIQLIELVPNHLDQILTSPVYPGTVQLTPAGKLIILMRDAQVTGGYPRIFQLTDDSINIISQKGYGQKVKFNIIFQYQNQSLY